nr:heat shock protein 90 [Sugarcane mild mosaic virus]
MALTASNAYVFVDRNDVGLHSTFRRFYLVSDVSSYINEIVDYIEANPNVASSTITSGGVQFTTWFRLQNGRLTAWSDGNGYAKPLLYYSLKLRGIFNNSYYSEASQMPLIFSLSDASKAQLDGFIGKTVTETSAFPYKFSVDTCKQHVVGFQLDVDSFSTLCFKLANYLNRLPTKAELTGQVQVTSTSQVKSSFLPLNFTEYTDNENFVGEEISHAEVAKSDPVKNVLWLKYRDHKSDLMSLLLEPEVVQAYKKYELLEYQLYTALADTRRNLISYEDRLNWLADAAQAARPHLRRWLFKVKQPSPLDVVRTIDRKPSENIEGSWSFLREHLPDGSVRNFFLTPYMPLSEEAFRNITYDLINGVLKDNKNLNISFSQIFLCVLQVLATTRTNGLRNIDRNYYHEFEVDGTSYLINFFSMRRVFSNYLHLSPNIERAYAACAADIVFEMYKQIGGAPPIWRDIPGVYAHMNFDFVSYVNPLRLNDEEKRMLLQIQERFRTKTSRIGGNTIGNRGTNPIDEWVKRLVPSQSVGTFYELLGTSNQVIGKH